MRTLTIEELDHVSGAGGCSKPPKGKPPGKPKHPHGGPPGKDKKKCKPTPKPC